MRALEPGGKRSQLRHTDFFDGRLTAHQCTFEQVWPGFKAEPRLSRYLDARLTMPEAAGPWQGPLLLETLFHVPNLRHITMSGSEREYSSKVNTAAERPG